MEKQTNVKKKLLFVYDLEDESLWKDGLWAAIELLKKDFEIFKLNLSDPKIDRDLPSWPDFVLGWGGFNSPVENYVSKFDTRENIKKGLCLGGYAPYNGNKYNVLFHETEWSKKWLEEQGYQGKMEHAFGVNTQIYKTMSDIHYRFPWEYITVGAFALWKRQTKILEKKGTKLAIGQIQKNNLSESIDIVGNLLLGGCAVSDMTEPEKLAVLYNLSENCYIPADLMGGGERAVLEARACGVPVEVEDDNPKLKELLTSPVWDEKYYAEQLKKGILECLN